MFVKSALLALGVASAAAGPVNKRQETTVAPSSITGASTVTVSSTETLSASELSSAMSSAATDTSMTPQATSTGTGEVAAPGNLTFSGCPDGYSLTYVIGTSEYPGVELSALTGALADWSTTTPPPIMVTESDGDGDIGATRTWTALNLTVMEQLTNVTTSETGSLNQMWNLTMPVTVSPEVTISNATTDFTIYSNSTSNVTSAQFYVNFCVSDQQAGLSLYADVVRAYLSGLPGLISADGASSTGMMSSASSAISSVSSSASAASDSISSEVDGAAGTATSAVGGAATTAVSAVSGAADTAISGVTGAADTAVSAVTGAAQTAISGATGVVQTAISGANGAAQTAISGASSVFGQVTNAILPSLAL